MYFVYKISNTVNDMLYIGITEDIEKRWYQHKCVASNTRSSQYDYPLYVAMREYGIEKFSMEPIDEGNVWEAMSIREQYWIQKLNTKQPHGYNKIGKPVDESTCRSIEQDHDRRFNTCSVCTYTNSLTGEIFAVRVDQGYHGPNGTYAHPGSVYDTLMAAARNRSAQGHLVKTIRSVWEQGGKVVVRKVFNQVDFQEAERLRDGFLTLHRLKRRGGIVMRV